MRETSYMIIIPKNPKDIEDPKFFIEHLKEKDGFFVQNIEVVRNRGILVDLQVDATLYKLAINMEEVHIPDFIRPQHAFTDEEYKQIASTGLGLSVCMDFKGDSAKCFYDQIRILDTLIPDILAVMDCPAEKLLSGKWVALAAKSKVMPAPRYLFTVQAVSHEKGEVWLHTHGLKRCGMFELEILCSTQETYNEHYHIIDTFATRMLESDEPIERGEAVYIARTQDQYLMCTAVDWKEALKYYRKAKLGTKRDRRDKVHSEDTCVLMMYKSPQDEEKKKYSPVQDFDPYITQNPMFMISTTETERMSALAIERVGYLKKAFENKENTIIAKIGLETDEQFGEEAPPREHIWFEIKDVKDDEVVGELTQAPYYVSNLKEGDIGTYPISSITDWMIFTKECRITPDDVYLMG